TIFLVTGFLEVFFLVLFFTVLAQSAILATSLALVFLTFFSYFILRLYLHARKPEQFQELQTRYITACQDLFNYQEDNPQHSMTLANACTKFANRLQGKENVLYPLPLWLEQLKPLFSKFSY